MFRGTPLPLKILYQKINVLESVASGQTSHSSTAIPTVLTAQKHGSVQFVCNVELKMARKAVVRRQLGQKEMNKTARNKNTAIRLSYFISEDIYKFGRSFSKQKKK